MDNTNTQTPAEPAGNMPPIHDIDIPETDDLDDLIPEELRAAVQKVESGKSQIPNKPLKAPVRETNEDIQDDIPPLHMEGDDEDINIDDLDDESLTKFLDGDTSVLKKAKKEEDVDTPIWHDYEGYQELVKKASYAGVTQDELDKIIEQSSDKKIIDNSKYLKDLETKNEEYARKLESQQKEYERLKNIERQAKFDSLPETKEKYGIPMTKDIQEMKKILDMEGAQVPLTNILNAKDKAEFTNMVKDVNFDDEDLLRLTNHWRSYRETLFRYNSAKESAQKNLGEHLKTSLNKEDVDNVLRNGLVDVLKSDEKYAYIKEAINEGLDKHEDVSRVIAVGKANFENLVKAMENPSDFIHNSEWLTGLAKFAFDTAHNKHIEEKYKSLQSTLSDRNQKLEKVLKAYKKLKQSGSGISGLKSGLGLAAKKAEKDSTKDDAEEFKALLTGDLDISEVL